MSGKSSGDTIFALSSGQPPAGVAVVRLSGPHVRFGLETLTDSVPEPRNASLRFIKGKQGEVVDQGLVLFFPGPASFTGEDVAELQVHGGRAVVAAVLAALGELPGFRPAEAGEFTRRAFLNRRLDLTQVEGLADLVASETEAQRRQALRQSGGALRDLYEGWRARLVRARALIEAELDFAEEEELPRSVAAIAEDEVAVLRGEISRHLDDSRRGERLREGAEIVLLGAPNAGKSSLLNALARREAAIVTPEPGTTRDLIEVRLDLEGYPATLVDTAGLREGGGLVEGEGMRRARRRAGEADLVLWLTDMTSPEDHTGSPSLDVPVWRIGTKSDLIDSEGERIQAQNVYHHVISTRTGDGLDSLLSALSRHVRDDTDPGESPLVTRERYRSALLLCLEAFDDFADRTQALEIRAETLRRAGTAIGRITGRIDVDDLLDVIFREFCIGK